MSYEVIIVGGGHAGCEAAAAAAKMNKKTLLVTSNVNNIADMPCNPSIGGSAKGIVVREIDALGGLMGKVADESQIQMKMLNDKKGPAVKALRAQVDKKIYPIEMLKTLKEIPNLTILEDFVINLIVEKNKVMGVETLSGKTIKSNAVILTTGTYMDSDILVGSKRTKSGPHGEKTIPDLSNSLKKLGFDLIRLKTGTPPRVSKSTIDFTKTKEEPGSLDKKYNFSFGKEKDYNISDQMSCHLIYTNKETHNIINENISKSSMYGGIADIEGVGPRYCPSIEDKITRFADKEKHQLFLEPESRYYDEIYIQGLSTSFPHDIQEKIVQTLPGLESAKILKYAYAIEYDALKPTQLKQNLETKNIKNLFTAGQINGTSGYEEAACQGLMAGINAVLTIEKKSPFVLKRNEAYTGVLIDDLITKGVQDPYRLLTSRAEFRLILRHDNADIRLRKYANKYGLINEKEYKAFLKKEAEIKELEKKLKENKLKPCKEADEILLKVGSSKIKDGINYFDLLKRPEINIEFIKKLINIDYKEEVIEQVVINSKYEGYIKKAYREAEKMVRLENKKIPQNIDYGKVKNIASEARQKLEEIRPTSIGQAIRISGVNPSDVSILMVYLKKGDFYD